jgi:hypothetical protein
MVLAFWHLMMDEDMKDSSKMIKERVSESN